MRAHGPERRRRGFLAARAASRRHEIAQGRDGLQLYRALCTATGLRQDPCVLDTLLAVVDFMNGAPPAPWSAYTPRRKAMVGQLRD